MATPLSQHTGVSGATAVAQHTLTGYTVVTQHGVAVPPPQGVAGHSGITNCIEVAQH